MVSMPPRRSCFGRRSSPGRGELWLFQCHHGVPASGFQGRRGEEAVQSFNATTAFLLSRMDDRPAFYDFFGFNATTAFLLSSKENSGAARRELFQCHHGVPAFLRQQWRSSHSR